MPAAQAEYGTSRALEVRTRNVREISESLFVQRKSRKGVRSRVSPSRAKIVAANSVCGHPLRHSNVHCLPCSASYKILEMYLFKGRLRDHLAKDQELAYDLLQVLG